MPLVAVFVLYAIRAYMLLIFVYVLGSWFPQWQHTAWYSVVSDIVRPYLNIFRAIPLKMGMIDMTPMLAMFALIILERMLMAAVLGGMM